MNSPNDLIPPLAGLIVLIAALSLTKFMVYQRKKELAKQENRAVFLGRSDRQA